jgi:hypothetical protein
VLDTKSSKYLEMAQGHISLSPAGLAEVTRCGPYRCGGRRRYPSSEGAPFGRAAAAAHGDEAGVDSENSRMSSTSLSADDLLKWVTNTVGRPDAGALSQPAMRPDCGYVSLVSVRSSFCFVSSSLRL